MHRHRMHACEIHVYMDYSGVGGRGGGVGALKDWGGGGGVGGGGGRGGGDS